MEIQRRTAVVDGLVTGYLEAGNGDPVILLHGGEFEVPAPKVSAGKERFPHLQSGIGCWHRTCWGLGSRPKSSISMTGAACASVISPGSATSSASTRHISSAIRWAPSTCSSMPPRVPRCYRCAPWWPSAAAGKFSATSTWRRSTRYDATPPAMRRIVEALFHDPSFPSDDDLRAAPLRIQHDARCLGDPRRGSVFPAARRCRFAPRHRRVSVPTDKSRFRRLWSRAGATSSFRSAGRKRSPTRFPADGRPLLAKTGHCPQIEQSSIVNALLLDFLADADTTSLAGTRAKRAQSKHSSFVKVRTVCC